MSSKEYNRKYRQRNKKRLAEYFKNYYNTPIGKKVILRANKKYREKHPDKVKQSKIKFLKNNPEYNKQKSKEWYYRNKDTEKYKESRRKYIKEYYKNHKEYFKKNYNQKIKGD
jgi:hypothetical protein